LFVHLSDWWVRSLLVIAIGLAADLASRRRFPLEALLAAISYLVATLLANVLKAATDRPSPSVADPAIHPLVVSWAAARCRRDTPWVRSPQRLWSASSTHGCGGPCSCSPG
jgi:hypothetical protein